MPTLKIHYPDFVELILDVYFFGKNKFIRPLMKWFSFHITLANAHQQMQILLVVNWLMLTSTFPEKNKIPCPKQAAQLKTGRGISRVKRICSVLLLNLKLLLYWGYNLCYFVVICQKEWFKLLCRNSFYNFDLRAFSHILCLQESYTLPLCLQMRTCIDAVAIVAPAVTLTRGGRGGGVSTIG